MQRNSYFKSTNVPQKIEPVGNMTKKTTTSLKRSNLSIFVNLTISYHIPASLDNQQTLYLQ